MNILIIGVTYIIFLFQSMKHVFQSLKRVSQSLKHKFHSLKQKNNSYLAHSYFRW